MSEASIPPSNGHLKPLTLDGLIKLAQRANKAVERANDQLGADSPMRFELIRIPGPGAPPAPAKPKRLRIPRESCHQFHAKVATDPIAKLPPIPSQTCR